MKKLLAAFAICAVLMTAFFFAPVLVRADESVEDTGEVVATEETSETVSKIDEILAKLKENEEIQWIKTYVIPAVTGAGASVLGLIIILFPSLKKRKEYAQLSAAYATLNKAYKDLEENTNADTIKKVITDILGEELTNKFKDLEKQIEVDKAVLADANAQAKATYSQTAAIAEALKVALRASPAAVNALTVSPTAETVKETEEENLKLREYIAREKGGEAVTEALKG